MGFDNGRVHDLIQGALDRQTTGDLLSRLDQAFVDVNGQRSQRCGDLELTAADHYLFCRGFIAKFSPAAMGPLAVGVTSYDGVYKAAGAIVKQIAGRDIVIRTGGCPAAVFSLPVAAWAHTGIADGATDCLYLKWVSSPRPVAPRVPAGIAHLVIDPAAG